MNNDFDFARATSFLRETTYKVLDALKKSDDIKAPVVIAASVDDLIINMPVRSDDALFCDVAIFDAGYELARHYPNFELSHWVVVLPNEAGYDLTYVPVARTISGRSFVQRLDDGYDVKMDVVSPVDSSTENEWLQIFGVGWTAGMTAGVRDKLLQKFYSKRQQRSD